MGQIKRNQGFNLIELLIVVFIIGTLAAIALPVMINYTTRTKTVEGVAMTGALRREVELFWNMSGYFPGSNEEAGISPPDRLKGKYVSRIEVGPEGVLTVYYLDPALPGGTLTLSPSVSADAHVIWACSSDTIEPYLLPRECRP